MKQPKQAKGTLIMKPLSAKLTYTTEYFGKMDPYCNITVGSTQLRTKTANNMGKTPAWSDTLTFNLNGENQAHVVMFDKDVGSKDDYICETNINLLEVISQKNYSNW